MQKKIIVGLRKNGRHKINSLAKQHGFPVSTTFDVLNRLEKSGIVQHKSNVKFEEIGFPIRIFVALKTDSANREILQKYLENSKNVNSLHLINSSFDFMIEALFRNQKESNDFFEQLKSKHAIAYKNVYNVIQTIHTEKFLSEEGHFE